MEQMKDLVKDLFEMQDRKIDFQETGQKVHGYHFKCRIETNLEEIANCQVLGCHQTRFYIMIWEYTKLRT